MRIITGIAIWAVLLATSAAAKDYLYMAHTLGQARIQGQVQAGPLSWTCRFKTCTIVGPWPTPGVSACAALAKKVGPLATYGHSGAKLNSLQMRTCNAGGKASVPVMLLRPRLALAIKPKLPSGTRPGIALPSSNLQFHSIATPSITADTAATRSLGVETGLEEGSYNVFRLYVRTPGIAYTGSYSGTYSPPDLGAPLPHWADKRLLAPPLSLIASPPPGERPRPHGTLPADSVLPGTSENFFIDMLVDMRQLPQAIAAIEVGCAFSQLRKTNEGSFSAGDAPFSAQSVIGNAKASLWVPDNRQIRKILHIPVKLRPFAQKGDVRAVQCQSNFLVARSGGGVNHVSGPAAIDPASRRFVPGMAPTPGSTAAVRTTFNIGG